MHMLRDTHAHTPNFIHFYTQVYICTHIHLYMYTHIKALRYLTSGFTREKTFKAINKSRILLQILSGS